MQPNTAKVFVLLGTSLTVTVSKHPTSCSAVAAKGEGLVALPGGSPGGPVLVVGVALAT